MDSALSLPFGPLHFHSNKSTTRVLTKPSFTFNPSPGFRRRRPQTFGNVVLATDNRLSKPCKEIKGGDNGIVRGTVGASLVLACAVAMMGCSGKLSPKAFAVPPIIAETLSTGMPDSPFTAKGALKSFLGITVQLATENEKPKKGGNISDRVPRRPSKEDVDSLKKEAVKLMKAGKCNEAETQVRKVYERVKNDPEPAYNVEMALVEILIAQGKYKEAYSCNCIKFEPGGYRISDARLPLYKAILCTMIGDERAIGYWNFFTDNVVPYGDPSGGPSGGPSEGPSEGFSIPKLFGNG